MWLMQAHHSNIVMSAIEHFCARQYKAVNYGPFYYNSTTAHQHLYKHIPDEESTAHSMFINTKHTLDEAR